jgi:hypothetical protein
MSAFLVSDSHLDAIVTAAIFGPAEVRSYPERWSPPRFGRVGGLRCEPSNGSALGLALLRENEASLAARYPGRWGTPADGYSYMQDFSSFARLPALAVLKLIDCYQYQSCEHDGWEASDAAFFCTKLRESLISHLPGYDALPWSLD